MLENTRNKNLHLFGGKKKMHPEKDMGVAL